MNIGIILPNLEINQLAYETISHINHEVSSGSRHNYRIFFEDISTQITTPLCAVMNLSEIWGFSGLLVSTTLDNTLSSLKLSTDVIRAFYIWDLEWLRDKKDYIANLTILRSPNLFLIARNEECAKEIERYSNRYPNIIMPTLQLGSLADTLCPDAVKQVFPQTKVLEEYKGGESITSLAKKYNVYRNTIYRFLLKHTKIRDKSESQKLALKTGRKQHPTEGTHRTDDEKLKIATGKQAAWQKYTPEELADLSEKGKAGWDGLTQKEKDERISKANEGSRIAAKEGSKVEKYIKHLLEDNGFKPKWHTKVLSTKLEVDFYIPSLNTVIEVNGPSHYLDIWGADKLQQQQSSDNQKYAVLVAKQIHIVRIKYLVTKLTLLVKEKLKKDIISLLGKIKDEKTIYIHDIEVI